ncbi:MAG: trigger factor [Alphaproteobacteria bacterium]
MEVTENNAEGLKREFTVTVTAGDLDARLNTRLEELKGQVHLKGFRPGKVPVSFLKKTHGKAIMGEILEQVVTETSDQALKDRDLRPALDPKIELQGEVAEVIDGKADLTYTMALEILPEIEVMDLSTLTLERPVAEVADEDVEAALKELADGQKSYAARGEGEAAEDGDRLTIDFTGDIEGEPFEGGSGESINLVIGAGTFIPGFEEQLKGAKAGDKVDVNVTFPEDYGAEHLAGKDAHFAVEVQDVAAPEAVEINDEFAEKFGLENLEKLRELMEGRLKDNHNQMSRLHLKRHLLDALDEGHSFELPGGMVSAEFDQIWHQVEADYERQGKKIEDDDKSEEDLRTEYRQIAERRVRLGLVLSEVGRKHTITVGQEEITRAIAERARQLPGQEQRVFEFYRNSPQALQEIRAPLFEDKVVDFILELATVNDKTVTKDELFKDPEGEEDTEKAA